MKYDHCNARLVTRGFEQIQSMEYNAKLAPAIRFTTSRLFLCIVANEDLALYYMDVKNSCLNGGLDEEVYT